MATALRVSVFAVVFLICLGRIHGENIEVGRRTTQTMMTHSNHLPSEVDPCGASAFDFREFGGDKRFFNTRPSTREQPFSHARSRVQNILISFTSHLIAMSCDSRCSGRCACLSVSLRAPTKVAAVCAEEVTECQRTTHALEEYIAALTMRLRYFELLNSSEQQVDDASWCASECSCLNGSVLCETPAPPSAPSISHMSMPASTSLDGRKLLTLEECAASCFGYTCEYWSNTCDELESAYGCDCSGCICYEPSTSPTVSDEPTASPAPTFSRYDVSSHNELSDAVDSVPGTGRLWVITIVANMVAIQSAIPLGMGTNIKVAGDSALGQRARIRPTQTNNYDGFLSGWVSHTHHAVSASLSSLSLIRRHAL